MLVALLVYKDLQDTLELLAVLVTLAYVEQLDHLDLLDKEVYQDILDLQVTRVLQAHLDLREHEEVMV